MVVDVHGLYSGGTMVTVTGQRLDVVMRPLLAVYVGDDVFTSVSSTARNYLTIQKCR